MVLGRRDKLGIAAVCLLLAAAAVSGSQNPDPLTADVRSVESDTNEGRRRALERILGDLGVDFERESFTIAPRQGYPRTEGTNLVVTVGEGEWDLVVGAHYDAAWLAGGVLSRGAVDNASSSVLLAHLAAVLGADPPGNRVRIVFFDMEEIGLVGSRRFIEAHREDPMRAAVNLDVNGYGDTVFYGPSSAEGNEAVYEVMREHCVGEAVACMEFPAYPASDHQSFQAAGVPNISLSLLPAGEAAELRRFLGEDRVSLPAGFVPAVLRLIHSPLDTAERVEEAALELGLRSLVAFVRRLDRSFTSAPVFAESPIPE